MKTEDPGLAIEATPDVASQAARVFDAASDRVLDRFAFRARAASFDAVVLARGISKLTEPPQGDVNCLDVGCNIGAKSSFLLALLGQLGCTSAQIDAIDVSERAIEIARDQNPFPGVDYKVADFLELEKGDRLNDYVFLSAVWHHLVDTRAAILKMEEQLRPGGLGIIFNIFYPESDFCREFVLKLQAVYSRVEKRTGLYATEPLVSDIHELVETECGGVLEYLGDFPSNLPGKIFNVRMVVIKKVGHMVG